MTDIQLEDALKSMGMACFVKYYPYFIDASYSTDDIAELMIRNKEGWSTILQRASNGRRIITAGRGDDALRRIMVSRADPEFRKSAEELLFGSS